MFRLFKRKPTSHPRGRVDTGAVREGVDAARVGMGSLGGLPERVAAGPHHEPTPEYIAEAPAPSEEAWAREQALYRAKNEGAEPPSA